eukprot:scaffold24096_cov64-Phaeocystis_antarctica.AAC.5
MDLYVARAVALHCPTTKPVSVSPAPVPVGPASSPNTRNRPATRRSNSTIKHLYVGLRYPAPRPTACPSRPAPLSPHWPRPAHHHCVALIPRARSRHRRGRCRPQCQGGGIIPKASATSPHPRVASAASPHYG